MTTIQVIGLLREILPTLAEFHKHAILHRDIKPSSIHFYRLLLNLTFESVDIMYNTNLEKYFLIDFSVTKFIEDCMYNY